ncbi:MAG: hypothetical protein H8E22_00915 [Candidatus Cloacimonetes bacterium]|nr:hypothetical protein [Candidatus Cloacimonadota bacterium]
MKRIVHKTHSFKDAEKWDIQQQINMTPQQRMEAAKELKDRVYGKTTIDVREYHERNKKN